MGKIVVLSKLQKKQIRNLYSTENVSVNAISRKLDISRHQVYKFIEEEKLKRSEKVNYGGTKTNWTSDMEKILSEGYNDSSITVTDIANKLNLSESTVTIHAKSLGLVKRVKRSLTEHDIETIEKLGETNTLAEIAEYMSVDTETLRKTIKDYNINYVRKKSNVKVPLTDEFFSDIRNPRYSGYDLSIKYNVTREAILYWRKKLYGDFKLQLNTNERLNEIEHGVAEILEDLDIAYMIHKKLINKWTVDFYLGNKHVIEVNGKVWHENSDNKLKDKRKLRQLKRRGYKILTITVDHKLDKSNVRQQIQRFWVTPSSNTRENKVVNARQSGVTSRKSSS